MLMNKQTTINSIQYVQDIMKKATLDKNIH